MVLDWIRDRLGGSPIVTIRFAPDPRPGTVGGLVDTRLPGPKARSVAVLADGLETIGELLERGEDRAAAVLGGLLASALLAHDPRVGPRRVAEAQEHALFTMPTYRLSEMDQLIMSDALSELLSVFASEWMAHRDHDDRCPGHRRCCRCG